MSDSGKSTWKLQRISSILLIPLVSYLLVKILNLSKLSYADVLSQTSTSWFVLSILIFAVIGLFHMRVGIFEILEDYVQDKNVKKFLKILISISIFGILTFVCLSLLLILMICELECIIPALYAGPSESI